jgi:hypothetical protein
MHIANTEVQFNCCYGSLLLDIIHGCFKLISYS